MGLQSCDPQREAGAPSVLENFFPVSSLHFVSLSPVKRFQLSRNMQAGEGRRKGGREGGGEEKKNERRKGRGWEEERKQARKEGAVKVILALIQQIFFAHLLAGFKSSNSKIL